MNDNNILVLNNSRYKSEGCRNCVHRSNCLAAGLNDKSHAGGNKVIHHKPVHLGQLIFAVGDSCNGIYLVRSGAFKSYFVDENGELQILGFHLPGELFGAEGLVKGTYTHYVESLGTGSVCKIPLSLFEGDHLATNNTNMSLLRIMGQVITRDQQLIFILSKLNAQQKFAYFLYDLANRLRQQGFELPEISLGMSRADIANYLGMAVETVSRLFTRMQEAGILAINRRRLRIHDMEGLKALANEAAASDMLWSNVS